MGQRPSDCCCGGGGGGGGGFSVFIGNLPWEVQKLIYSHALESLSCGVPCQYLNSNTKSFTSFMMELIFWNKRTEESPKRSVLHAAAVDLE